MKHILLFIGVLIMSFNSPQTFAESEILKAHTAEEIQNIIKKSTADAIILFDIDDTIITPVSHHFRSEPHKRLIDNIKKNKHLYDNYETIVSNWRLQRKVMLVDEQWPNIINQLKETHKVYGLTKMDTGKFGNIASMESWRYNELKSLNIEFSHHEALDNHFKTIQTLTNGPAFINGIFITGSKSKHETLDQFHDFLNTKQIVFIDDREEHIADVQKYCEKHHISFIGILYKGVDKLPVTLNPKVIELQKEYLLKHGQWLEDEEAEKLVITKQP